MGIERTSEQALLVPLTLPEAAARSHNEQLICKQRLLNSKLGEADSNRLFAYTGIEENVADKKN
ncbi:hypothetical protein V1477_006572 [Vespula maculifrons]|uniref:Uncharacterized protein n=1 Tax=Vespula maculifrons TaxID=7453 RepID=A0ABD2CJ70_VESMC